MCTPPVRGSHGLAAEVEHPLLDRSHCKSVDGLEQAASSSVHEHEHEHEHERTPRRQRSARVAAGNKPGFDRKTESLKMRYRTFVARQTNEFQADGVDASALN